MVLETNFNLQQVNLGKNCNHYHQNWQIPTIQKTKYILSISFFNTQILIYLMKNILKLSTTKYVSHREKDFYASLIMNTTKVKQLYAVYNILFNKYDLKLLTITHYIIGLENLIYFFFFLW